MKRVFLSIWRTLRTIVLGVSLVVLLGIWAIRLPVVQDWLLPRLENLVGNQLGTEVHIGGLRIDLPARIALSQVEVEDQLGQPMFRVGELRLGLASFSYGERTVEAGHVGLLAPEANLYRSRRDSSLNLDFLIPEKDTTAPDQPFDLTLIFPDIRIREGRFSMVDSTLSDSLLSLENEFNASNFRLRGLDLDATFRLEPDIQMEGDIQRLTVYEEISGLALERLSTQAQLKLGKAAPGGLWACLENLQLKAGRNVLDLDAEINNQAADTLDQMFSPDFKVNFRPSQLDFYTLNLFLNPDLPMEDPVQVSGWVQGDLESIVSDTMRIDLYDKTRLLTGVEIRNFTKAQNLTIDLDLYAGQLSFEELDSFLTTAELPLSGDVRVSGKASLDLNQIYAPDLKVWYGDQTVLNARVRLHDYASVQNLLLDVKVREGKAKMAEVRRMLPGVELPEMLENLGLVRLEGRYIGGLSDFVVDAKVKTPHGNAVSNIHLVLPSGKGDLAYEGALQTDALDLDVLGLDSGPISQNLNFKGKIKGKGTDFYTMKADIEGTFLGSEVMGYRLDKLETEELKIDAGTISGGLKLTDEQGNASVSVDLSLPRDGEHSYWVIGDVANLDLAHYGVLPTDSVFLTSILNVRLRGDSLENYTGRLKFFEIHLNRENADSIALHDVNLRMQVPEPGSHRIDLSSSVADMSLSGAFALKEAFAFGSQLGQEVGLFLRNNDTLIQQYYEQKVPHAHTLALRDTLWTREELNHVFEFFRVPVFFQTGSRLALELKHAETDQLDFHLLSDSFSVASLGLEGNDMVLNLNKLPMENVLLLEGNLASDHFWPTSNLRIEEMRIRPEGDNQQMDFYLSGRQTAQDNLFQLDVRTLFKKNGEIHTTVQPLDSRLEIRGQTWQFAKGNLIRRVWERPPSLGESARDTFIDRFHVENLRLFHQGQEIEVDGVVSTDFLDVLNVNLRQIRLGTFMEILQEPVDLDGDLRRASIQGWNLLSGQPGVFGQGEISNFSYRSIDSVGIKFDAGWPYFGGPDYAGLNVRIDKEGRDSLQVDGYYRISTDSLHFDAKPSSVELAWLEPFTDGIVSDLEGRLRIDALKIRGTTQKPRLDGAAHFNGAGLKVDYLNAFFRLGDNTLTFNNDQVEIPGISVRDTFGHSARLSGDVRFESLAGMRLDLRFDQIDNLTVMDTRKRHNPDFYGRIVLDGTEARISGPVTNLYVEANVTTGAGSWLDIPLDNYTSASRLDYVYFLSGDTLEVEQETEISGLGMQLTVNATPDAKVRLIFDEQVGDIIEAQGEGAITLRITEEGEFLMFGAYTLTKGNYLFTAENIVNKKFVVRPGGRIVWSGEPYDADLDLDAVYRVNADISDLIGGQSARVPVDIVMHMKGSLENPVINLELLLDQMQQQDILGLASYFRGIQYDQQELNKQVVSLLLFGRFTGHASAYNGSSPVGGVTSSISELISNQVNYWISQAFQDANLGLEVNTNQFQDVELAIRTTLFNDRVTVERNGTLISNQQRSFSIGDLSVQIKLLPLPDSSQTADPNAGQLVLEIFNREDASLNSNLNVTRGVGVFYKKDFDRIRDLFK